MTGGQLNKADILRRFYCATGRDINPLHLRYALEITEDYYLLYSCETVCWHFPADTVRYHFRLQKLWSHSVLRFAGNRLQIAAVRLQWFFGMLG